MQNPANHKSFKAFLIANARRITALLILAVAVIVASAYIIHSKHQTDQAANEAPTSPNEFQPTPDQLAALKIEPVGQITFHSQQTAEGKIAINDDTTTPVFSPYSGRVTKLIAKAGNIVKQGDPLFTIEATEFVQAQNDLIAAAAALNSAKAELKLAVTTEKRQHELYEVEGTPLKTWQQSQVDLSTAQATLRSNEIAYAEARNHLRIFGKSDQDIDAIENAPDAQKMAADTTVVAPRDGTVIQRQIGLGQFIQSGNATPVYTIGDLSTVWLVANVREVDAPLMHVGAPIEVHVLAFPDQVFKAKLSYVAASVDATTHRLQVRAEVENPDASLKPEMFASFSIVTGDDTQALAAPESAVVYEGTTAHVWLAKDDKTIILTNVKTGRIDNGMVEILDGLNGGDKVVTSGALFIDRAAAGN